MVEPMNMRDIRRPLELPSDELKSLIDKLEEITGAKFNDAFADQINNFIGILREKYLVEEHTITNREMGRELTKLRSALRKASDILNDQLSDHSQMAIFSALPEKRDSVIASDQSIKILLTACETAIKGIEKRGKGWV